MKTRIVEPKPYFEISMECSNRRFYNVKSTLWNLAIANNIDQDIIQGYMSESCDYEGDLNKITIYNCDETKQWIELIKNEFLINVDIPKEMNIVFVL